jgi:CRP-like cAMP-binding protein
MKSMVLGKYYRDGEVIARQGELGTCMYVIQEGKVEMLHRKGSTELSLAELEAGDFFAESGLLEQGHVLSATFRAVGDTCVLSIEKRAFLNRIHEDPSFVVKMLRKLSRRNAQLEAMLVATAVGELTPQIALDATLKQARTAAAGGGSEKA